VLARPGQDPIDLALRRQPSARVVVADHVVDTERGPFAHVPFVPGVDVLQLRQARQAPLPAALALTLLDQTALALLHARQAGVHHGALEPSSVRLDTDGFVRVLGFRGGSEAEDCHALLEILEALCETDHDALPDALAERAGDWPQTLEGVRERLAGERVDLREHLPDELTPLYPHALAGQIISARREGSGAPSKVQLAAVGAVTLALGLAAGWALAGWGTPGPGASPGEVVVEGAVEVRLDCDPQEHGGPRLGLDAPRTCRVTARMPDGTERVGDLDGPPMGRYLCVGEDGGLTCSEQ